MLAFIKQNLKKIENEYDILKVMK